MHHAFAKGFHHLANLASHAAASHAAASHAAASRAAASHAAASRAARHVLACHQACQATAHQASKTVIAASAASGTPLKFVMTEIGVPVVTGISVHLFKEIFSTMTQKHAVLLQKFAHDKDMLRAIYQAEASNATKYAHNFEISHKMSDLAGNIAASSIATVAHGYLR